MNDTNEASVFAALSEEVWNGILDAHPDLERALEILEARKTEGARADFPLPGEFASVESSPYLVKGLLDKPSHAIMFGAPGAGKTTAALDLAAHVATGAEWYGRKVARGTVLYLAYEGLAGMRKRVRALLDQGLLNPDSPLFVVSSAWKLRDKAERIKLAEYIACMPSVPDLIVIDTLARSMAGGDENSAQDTGLLNEAAALLGQAARACVLFVHHSGKNQAKGGRGSSALLGAVDTELEVIPGQIKATKLRDHKPGAPMPFTLRDVELGKDEDGEPIVACVLDHVAGAAPAPELPKRAKLALGTLRALVDVFEDKPVPVESWRKEFRRVVWPVEPPSAANLRVEFNRAVEKLVAAGLCRVADDHVELIQFATD